MLRKTLSAIVGTMFLSSCAIHPVPDDVTGLSTPDIVRQIRCEARDAAKKLVVDEFHLMAISKDSEVADLGVRLYNTYSSPNSQFSDFKPDQIFVGAKYIQAKNYTDLIYNSAIAYNFDLTMSETNNLNAGLDVLGNWAPKFTMGVNSDLNRTRTNERTFTISDTFKDLIKDADTVRVDKYCNGKIILRNYIYPIAGNIGVYKTVEDFFNLQIFDNLSTGGSTNAPSKTSAAQGGGTTGASAASQSAAPAKASSQTGSSPAAMADALTFQTTIDLSLTPKVTFTPGTGLRLSDAFLGPSVSRVDTHKVYLGMSLPGTAAQNALCSLTNFVFARSAAGKATCSSASRPTTQTVIGNPKNQAEANAISAIDQVRAREIIIITAP